tara:strand:+ start:12988 stop:13365 length:378 start_codon:yes stop_codon:yes gene_type:complete
MQTVRHLPTTIGQVFDDVAYGLCIDDTSDPRSDMEYVAREFGIDGNEILITEVRTLSQAAHALKVNMRTNGSYDAPVSERIKSIARQVTYKRKGPADKRTPGNYIREYVEPLSELCSILDSGTTD